MNKSIYLFLTQLTVITHLLFILFVIVGGFFAREKPWIRIVHLASVIWALYAELSPGVLCPLTTLENYFGLRADLSTYEEDFITRSCSNYLPGKPYPYNSIDYCGNSYRY